jgi:hypothetical protein
MDTLSTYRQTIEQVLTRYTKIPYAYGEIQTKTIFDHEKDSYLLLTVGWQDDKRIHGCLVHIDILDDKLWIQRDGTEHGIARELVEAGIPKEKIVLAFHPPEVRDHTEYAIA